MLLQVLELVLLVPQVLEVQALEVQVQVLVVQLQVAQVLEVQVLEAQGAWQVRLCLCQRVVVDLGTLSCLVEYHHQTSQSQFPSHRSNCHQVARCQVWRLPLHKQESITQCAKKGAFKISALDR